MPTTNFKNSSGTDIGNTLVEKSYLIDRYPELADTFKQAGLYGWGQNYVGQLGDNTGTDRSSPVQTVAGGTNWSSITVAWRRSAYGIKTDGTLWVWGSNGFGQLGLGDTSNRSTPAQLAGTTWKQVSGGVFGMAIKTDGTLWGWGYNDTGQLGNNTSYPNSTSSPTQIGSATTWKMVSCGSYHTAAIKTDNTLWMWGQGNGGRLGLGDTSNRSTPVQLSGTWKMASGGAYHTAAIKTDGTLWTWGEAGSGKLGDGTTTQRSSPVQTVGEGTNWKMVSAGSYHTAAIKTDGTLWTWGGNAEGQLGDGTIVSKSSPVQTISSGTNWKMISVSGHSMAIKTDGTLWTWGVNTWGQIGDGTTTHRSSPVQIAGTNWKQVDAGGYSSVSSSHAIRDDSADIFGNNL